MSTMTTERARSTSLVTTSRLSHRGLNHAGVVPALFHFTCEHFWWDIRAVGAVVPHRHPLFPTLGPVVWFTTEREPDRYRVGLTSDTLACDRMAHRFRVAEHSTCIPWIDVREAMLDGWQPGFDRETLHCFEFGRAPHTWWLSRLPVPVVLDDHR
jgi:hypothetical protein